MTTNIVRPDKELVKKWIQIFRFYDVDNDGILTKKDIDTLQDKILNKAINLSEDKKREVSQLSHYMWADMFEKEDSEEFQLKEMVPQMMKLVNKAKIECVTHEYRKLWFYCMDHNQDNTINYSEFLMFADCLGKSDEPYLDVAFNAIDEDGDGEVTLEEYINAYKKYLADPTVTIDKLPLFGLPE